jgi:hypothetical protein
MFDVKEIIENVGLIVASITAIYGINAWKREFRGKKKYELAEEVLAQFYDCRDRLREIRSPFSHNEEGSSRKKDPKEREEDTELLNRAYVVFERYQKYQETFNKLFALRYRFMALFGKEAAQPIEDFRIALNEVFISAQRLPNYWRRQGRVPMSDEQFKDHLKGMHKYEGIFWGTFSDKDEFNTKIEGIVSQIEATCSQIIRPPSHWWNF